MVWSLLTAVGVAVHVPRRWDDARQVFTLWGTPEGVWEGSLGPGALHQ